jgi:dienelactone hydrolase
MDLFFILLVLLVATTGWRRMIGGEDIGCGIAACALAIAAGFGSGCQSSEAVKNTFDYGRAYLPAEATKSGQEITYQGAVLKDRKFGSERSLQGYRNFPGSWLDAAGARIKPGTRWPVVVFLHGCSGYQLYTDTVARYYLAVGAIVVAPNSMNRPGRVAMCGAGSMAYRANMRKREAQYAVEQLATRSWVDSERIVLAGHSEGGNAVAAYSGDGFAAHIITGISCRHNNGAVSAPSGTPVLAIKGADDTTYPDGICSVGRTVGGSRSVLIPDRGHGVVTYREAQLEIYDFLRQCCDIGR